MLDIVSYRTSRYVVSKAFFVLPSIPWHPLRLRLVLNEHVSLPYRRSRSYHTDLIFRSWISCRSRLSFYADHCNKREDKTQTPVPLRSTADLMNRHTTQL